jgi:hypothetical protein
MVSALADLANKTPAKSSATSSESSSQRPRWSLFGSKTDEQK